MTGIIWRRQVLRTR